MANKNQPKKKTSLSAEQALDYEMIAPDPVRRVLKYTFRVSEDSAQRNLVTHLRDVFHALDRPKVRWLARKELVSLAKVCLAMADREELHRQDVP